MLCQSFTSGSWNNCWVSSQLIYFQNSYIAIIRFVLWSVLLLILTQSYCHNISDLVETAFLYNKETGITVDIGRRQSAEDNAECLSKFHFLKSWIDLMRGVHLQLLSWGITHWMYSNTDIYPDIYHLYGDNKKIHTQFFSYHICLHMPPLGIYLYAVLRNVYGVESLWVCIDKT